MAVLDRPFKEIRHRTARDKVPAGVIDECRCGLQLLYVAIDHQDRIRFYWCRRCDGKQ